MGDGEGDERLAEMEDDRWMALALLDLVLECVENRAEVVVVVKPAAREPLLQ